jgi:glycosyltransferase involved in cell wall biosynthesis
VKLIVAANARIPSEKAHPYQIVQMCEAFGQAGAEVTLLLPDRRNRLATDDVAAHYGVEPVFGLEYLPVIDLYPGARLFRDWFKLAWRLWLRLAALVVMATYHLSLLGRIRREQEATLYTRDAATLGLVAVLWPSRARQAVYEAHTYPETWLGLRLRRWLVGRTGGWVTITDHLRQRYEALGVPPGKLLVAHDGYRATRFAIDGDRAHWRRELGWSPEAFIVGYAGRFIGGREGVDKGIGTLTDAAIQLAQSAPDRPVRLALVGGPESVLNSVRRQVAEAGLPNEFLLAPGMVPVEAVPGYLQAFDVCVIPSPWTDFYAYYTSPLKLFEYMAAGKPIVATNLPSTAEILIDGQNGLLVPPSDPGALAGALHHLLDDLALGARLGTQATHDATAYTWEARAKRILAFMAEKRERV